MSLVGNLADLGLGDILQIVALSRKSGTLQLATGADAGYIAFNLGSIVGVFHERARSSVGDYLLTQKIIEPSTLQEMMSAQRATPALRPPELWTRFKLDGDVVEKALKKVVEATVYEMFRWDEGTFGFAIVDDMSTMPTLRVADGVFMLQNALNTQFVAMEGARLKDEARRTDPFASFMGVPEKTKVAEPSIVAKKFTEQLVAEEDVPMDDIASEPTHLIYIDDDARLAKTAETFFAGKGLFVHTCGKVDLGLRTVRELVWAKKPIVVVADLVIPRSDGAGILGGLEILEKLRADYETMPVVVVSEYPNDDAKRRSEQLNASGFLVKPSRIAVERDDASSVTAPFLGELWKVIDEVMPHREADISQLEVVAADATAHAARLEQELEQKRQESDELADATQGYESTEKITPIIRRAAAQAVLGIEPLEDAGLPERIAVAVNPPERDRLTALGREISGGEADEHTAEPRTELGALKSLLTELINPQNKEAITLLVLRYASELFGRAILLLVTRDEFVGLGGFAPDITNDEFVRFVRTVRLPIGESRGLAEVVRSRSARRRPLNATPAEVAFAQKMGMNPEQLTFAAPIVSGDRVPAILLGDNHRSGKEIGDTQGLEIFLLQAGLAMERTLLERRVKELAQKAGGLG